MIAPDDAPAEVTEVSAGGVVFRRVVDGVQVLLILDAYGQWALPKGHLEDGESLADAALREIREETGLRSLKLGAPLRTIEWRFRADRGMIRKVCHFFLVESPTGEAVPQLDEGITQCLWLPVDEAVQRISYRNTAQVLEEAAAELRAASSGAG